MNATCPLTSLVLALARVNHPALSHSGISIVCPERGGQSMVIMVLFIAVTSKSASTAQANTFLLPYLTSPMLSKSPSGTGSPVSSVNSRFAAACGSSLSSHPPFGTDHAPASFLAQNGPPGCTSITSTPLGVRRYGNKPAVSLTITVLYLIQIM